MPNTSRSRPPVDIPSEFVVDSNGKYQSVHAQARVLLAGPAHSAPIPRRPLVDVNSHAVSLGQVERDADGLVRSVTLVREGAPQIPFRYLAEGHDADVVQAVAMALSEFARRHPPSVV